MQHTLNRWPARLDLLQSLSGLLLVLFIWGHMFFESSILLGKDAMLWVTKMFEGEHLFGQPYPLLVSAAAAIVFLLIALHALLALRKFPASYRQYQRLNQHVGSIRHLDTTLWVVQVITGFLLFFLASVHLLVVMVQPDNIGIYRLAMKWGPFSAATSGLWRGRIKLTVYCIVAFYLCLGTASLVTYMRIGAEHAPYAGERYDPAIHGAAR